MQDRPADEDGCKFLTLTFMKPDGWMDAFADPRRTTKPLLLRHLQTVASEFPFILLFFPPSAFLLQYSLFFTF